MSENLPALAPDARVPDIVRHEIATGHVVDAKALLDVQITWERREAEKEFNAAFSRLEFPPIRKTKRGLNSDYPPLEEIQEITNPILKAQGFGVTFTSSKPDEKGLIEITGTLLHALGHSRPTTIHQPSGAASKGMNANQAIGSATSYGQRYCLKMMLNLRFIGMDDDAQSFSLITDDERADLEMRMAVAGVEPGSVEESRYLAYCKVKSLGDITRGGHLQMAIDALERARRKRAEQK